MRRAAATASASGGVPIDVGLLGTVESTFANLPCVWSNANPLNADGTITSVTANFPSNGQTFAIFLISPTNVIRSISADLVSTAGEVAYPVSLTGVAGDLIGFWRALSLNGRYHLDGAYNSFRNATSAKPTPGDTRARTFTDPGRHLLMAGIGLST